MMRALWLLTIKNLKLLLRSRSSALIIIFAPLLIILLLGLSYNNSAQFGLNIGVYSTAFTEDVNSFAQVLEEKEFTITRYNQLESCIGEIKSNNIHACISVPESLEIADNQQKVVTFYVDPSRVNLIGIIQETLQEKFSLKSQEISQELSDNIISRLLETKETIIREESNLNAIKGKTASAASSASSAQETLKGASLQSGENDIVVVNDTVVVIQNLLQEANDLIDNAKSSVNSAGIPEDADREEIRGYLNQAKEKLDSIHGDNQTGELALLREKLNAAASAINSASSKLMEIDASLKDANQALASLQASLNSIRANIERQRVTDAQTLASPLVSKIERVSQEGTYLNYLFPALLVLVVMFSSLLLGTTLVMIEKNSPAYLRNFFLPIRRINFIVSIYLTNVILTLVEILVILSISLFFLRDALAVIPSIALVLFLAGTVFTFLGMAVGYLFTSEETGVLASISLGSILLFTSGVILPLEGITPAIRQALDYNPFVVAEKLVREIFIFKNPLSSAWLELGILIGYAAVLFLVIWGIESLLHRQLTQRFLRKYHKSAKVKIEKKKELVNS
ncbi:ABC transporter permease [Candidatus Woesearchaeota archaeon]|nr:ABC transporter permease [Candidatus Woesearchaeota archaeon]